MRKVKVWSLVSLVALLAACSSKDDNNGAADVGHDTAQPADAGHDTAQPTDTAQPQDVTQPEPDAPLGADVAPDVPDEPDVPAQECAYPNADPMCPQGAFGPGTFLNTIEVVNNRSCCRDFDGDGMFDNKIGTLLGLLTTVGEDPNGNIAAAIQSGELAYVLEYANWSNEEYDSALDFRVLLGIDEDDDFTDNLAGTGSFLVRPESYEDNGAPKWNFDNASVQDGRLVATGGTLELFFPGLLDEVQMLIRDVRVEADVVAPATLHAGGGVTLENGEISGMFDRALFFDSMNEAANACSCLGKNVYVYSSSSDQYLCDIDSSDMAGCAAEPNQGCRFLADTTTCLFLQNISDEVDVDFDNDGTNDAFSVAVRFSGVPASIVGDL